MKILALGAGNAFSVDQGNQSFALMENGEILLIDHGTRGAQSLWEAGINPKDIKVVVVSHAHGDHIGGLEELAFSTYDWMKKPRHYSEGSYAPKLVANEQLMKELWENSLKGGLKSMEGFDATLETFFEVVPLKANTKFMWQGWSIDLVQQLHVMTGSVAMWTFGLLMEKEGHKTVYFTTDSQHLSPSQMKVFYKKADIIFQDCELIGCNFKFQEGQKYYTDSEGVDRPWPTDEDLLTPEGMTISATYEPKLWGVSKFTSGVHANYAELAGYESANAGDVGPAIRAKMWPSHTQDFRLINRDYTYKIERWRNWETGEVGTKVLCEGNFVDWDAQAKKDGFAGFVNKGMIWEV